MRSSAIRLVRDSFVACLALLFFAFLPGSARAADCGAGTLVTVVAHLDDDLLFVDPAISERLDAGWCITTVHLIGGANGADFAYVQTRERASRLAYARMAGVPDEWLESNVTIAGKLVHQMVLKASPRVRLLELRLPGGAVRGGRVPLGLLWEQRATLLTYPMNADGSARVKYDRDGLSATLKAILAPATLIYTLNPDTVPFIEHPDHILSVQRAEDKTAQLQARAGAIDELLASGALDDPSGMRKDDISAELDRMSAGSDVELELARMKAELGGGSAPTPAIEQGNHGQAAPQAPQQNPYQAPQDQRPHEG